MKILYKLFIFLVIFPYRGLANQYEIIYSPIIKSNPTTIKSLNYYQKKLPYHYSIYSFPIHLTAPVESHGLMAKIKNAENLIYSFEESKAISELDEVIHRLNQNPWQEYFDQVLITAHLAKAFAYYSLGQVDQLKASIKEALSYYPNLEIESSHYPPKFRSEFNLAKDYLLKRNKLKSVFIETKPNKLKVFANGFFYGNSPLSIHHLGNKDFYLLFELDHQYKKAIIEASSDQKEYHFDLALLTDFNNQQNLLTIDEKKLILQKQILKKLASSNIDPDLVIAEDIDYLFFVPVNLSQKMISVIDKKNTKKDFGKVLGKYLEKK